MGNRYTVINEKEYRGQSVAQDGIPCTARHCVTQLNRLSQDNEKLRFKIIDLESKIKELEIGLKNIGFVLKYNENKLKEILEIIND